MDSMRSNGVPSLGCLLLKDPKILNLPAVDRKSLYRMQLLYAFFLINHVFIHFNETFSIKKFIYGAGTSKLTKISGKSNFISGETKMAIYILRKSKIEDETV